MKLFRLMPALFAVALAACTVTVTSPVLEKLGAGISIGGGTPATSPVATVPPVVTPVVPPPPAVDPTASYWDSGTVSGAPYVQSAAGARWKFDPAAKCSIGAGVAINGIDIPNWCATVIKLGGDGFVYPFTTDGYWRRLRDMDAAGSGSVVGPPPPIGAPSAAPATGGSTPTAPPAAPAAAASIADPTPASPAPGTSGKVTAASPGGLATAIAAAAPGDTIQAAPGTYNESVGISVPLLVDGGGKVINPGDKSATYTTGAVLDGTGVANLREGQGGFVPLADTYLRGWEATKWGYAAASNDGTGAVRNNRGGVFHYEDLYLHHNQMGIAPHVGDQVLVTLKNLLLVDNGLPQAPGYAHNIYSYATHLIIQGGVTSIASQGSGDGHAGKFGNAVLEIYGKNYFRAWNTSSVDIPHGTAKPFIIKGDANGGTTIEKLAGDPNRVLLGYGGERNQGDNGNLGGNISGLAFVIPNDGQQYYVISSGPISFDSTCRFLYSDGSPVKSGTFVVQGSGTVTGLP